MCDPSINDFKPLAKFGNKKVNYFKLPTMKHSEICNFHPFHENTKTFTFFTKEYTPKSSDTPLRVQHVSVTRMVQAARIVWGFQAHGLLPHLGQQQSHPSVKNKLYHYKIQMLETHPTNKGYCSKLAVLCTYEIILSVMQRWINRSFIIYKPMFSLKIYLGFQP